MAIHHITGPAASGKTRHLCKIATAALSKGLQLLGPLPARDLQVVLRDREMEKFGQSRLPAGTAKTVLLVDEADNLSAAQRKVLEATVHLGWYQVFIVQTGALNKWENLA